MSPGTFSVKYSFESIIQAKLSFPHCWVHDGNMMNATLESEKCEKQAFNYSRGKVRSLTASSSSLVGCVCVRCEKVLFTWASRFKGQVEAKFQKAYWQLQPEIKHIFFLMWLLLLDLKIEYEYMTFFVTFMRVPEIENLIFSVLKKEQTPWQGLCTATNSEWTQEMHSGKIRRKGEKAFHFYNYFYNQKVSKYLLIYICHCGWGPTRVYQHSKASWAINQTHGVTSSATRLLQGLGALPFLITWCTPWGSKTLSTVDKNVSLILTLLKLPR